MPGAKSGFDLPQSWSPDGSHLAVLSFPGQSAANPGESSLVLASVPAGWRFLLAVGDIEVLGWVEADDAAD